MGPKWNGDDDTDQDSLDRMQTTPYEDDEDEDDEYIEPMDDDDYDVALNQMKPPKIDDSFLS